MGTGHMNSGYGVTPSSPQPARGSALLVVRAPPAPLNTRRGLLLGSGRAPNYRDTSFFSRVACGSVALRKMVCGCIAVRHSPFKTIGARPNLPVRGPLMSEPKIILKSDSPTITLSKVDGKIKAVSHSIANGHEVALEGQVLEFRLIDSAITGFRKDEITAAMEQAGAAAAVEWLNNHVIGGAIDMNCAALASAVYQAMLKAV